MSGTGAKKVNAPIRGGGGKEMEVEFIGFVVGVVFAAILFLYVITMVILILFGVVKTERRFNDNDMAKNADEGLSDATASL